MERINIPRAETPKVQAIHCFTASARLHMSGPYFPQQCLNFLPLPQGQASLRPTLGPARMGLAFSTAAAASLTMSLPLGVFEAGAWVAAESVPVVVPPKALVDW